MGRRHPKAVLETQGPATYHPTDTDLGDVVVAAVVGDEVLGIEPAACAEGAVGAKIAVDKEDEGAIRLEEAEDEALGVRGFGRD
jgi:hypothetical protein